MLNNCYLIYKNNGKILKMNKIKNALKMSVNNKILVHNSL